MFSAISSHKKVNSYSATADNPKDLVMVEIHSSEKIKSKEFDYIKELL